MRGLVVDLIVGLQVNAHRIVTDLGWHVLDVRVLARQVYSMAEGGPIAKQRARLHKVQGLPG